MRSFRDELRCFHSSQSSLARTDVIKKKKSTSLVFVSLFFSKMLDKLCLLAHVVSIRPSRTMLMEKELQTATAELGTHWTGQGAHVPKSHLWRGYIPYSENWRTSSHQNRQRRQDLPERVSDSLLANQSSVCLLLPFFTPTMVIVHFSTWSEYTRVCF